MKDQVTVCSRLREIFCEELQVEPPAVDDDLIEAGLLDSMMFVSLLMHLEEEFGTTVAIQDIEISDFSTIGKIARLVVAIDGHRAM